MASPDLSGVEFEQYRPRLFGLAYRMLGSAAEAEDVVQDAFLRFRGADREAINALSAWLTRVVTNLCLNRLAAAARQREHYIGPWLPEPVITEDGALGPLETVQQRDSVSLALLVLLERLTPAERAVFVLREAFAYGHREIAEIMGISEANCRQLHHRAKARVDEGRPRFQPDRRRQFDLLQRFLAAAQEGDLPALEAFLAEDVVSWSDGGGQVTSARRPVLGREKVARLCAGMMNRATGVEFGFAEVNGDPAVLGLAGPMLLGVWVMEVTGECISALRAVTNPEKLDFLARQLSRSGGLAGSS
ncbi:RNA polymerase sigma-70 factor [Amycolatopsis rhizosphaerae]|uniref:RNA polymerase sigma-70 factor n=1 Tax=Amycolatopsis rhizosphaerae TaxID=2053003 RepID=A0A558CFG4_9PSEU|nr:RNA polymerase sigma-70 factor [Amycolatopsis rhizosphaerae]TVT47511.1 RNA polymerase sigma-70 factor [Amycolatopsis rhizosphaerae]